MCDIMRIERNITTKMLQWKDATNRLPLIIEGARQIGKTWVMLDFGKRYFEYVAYFNFERDLELSALFESTKSVERIISQLVFHTNVPIRPESTLIIFDEIQECNSALNTLKYFSEDAPEYAVMAAGSLLGVALSKGDSFPVGKVHFEKMYPISFKEFLAVDQPDMYEFAESLNAIEHLPQVVLNKLEESLNRYMLTGGMPKVVSDFLDQGGAQEVETNLQNILAAYTLDFSKHAAAKDIPRIAEIWKSVPSQLSRENRKFLYKLVKTGARAREYEDALLWLQHAGLIYRVFAISKPHLPISAYDDLSAFKIFVSDIGLLRKMAQLPAEVIVTENPIFSEFKGAMTENYVLQSLVTQYDVMPRYWASSGRAEVDFVVQDNMRVIPIEVKSSLSIAGKSLSIYDDLFHPELRIRYSSRNLHRDGNLLNIPLSLSDWTNKLI